MAEGNGGQPLLEVQGLTARYGPIVAVRDVSLHVGEGEIVALLGANGAGKTTTLACIAGVHRNRTGGIRVRGRDVGGLVPERIVRHGVAYGPQDPARFQPPAGYRSLQLPPGLAVPGTPPAR